MLISPDCAERGIGVSDAAVATAGAAAGAPAFLMLTVACGTGFAAGGRDIFAVSFLGASATVLTGSVDLAAAGATEEGGLTAAGPGPGTAGGLAATGATAGAGAGTDGGLTAPGAAGIAGGVGLAPAGATAGADGSFNPEGAGVGTEGGLMAPGAAGIAGAGGLTPVGAIAGADGNFKPAGAGVGTDGGLMALGAAGITGAGGLATPGATAGTDGGFNPAGAGAGTESGLMAPGAAGITGAGGLANAGDGDCGEIAGRTEGLALGMESLGAEGTTAAGPAGFERGTAGVGALMGAAAGAFGRRGDTDAGLGMESPGRFGVEGGMTGLIAGGGGMFSGLPRGFLAARFTIPEAPWAVTPGGISLLEGSDTRTVSFLGSDIRRRFGWGDPLQSGRRCQFLTPGRVAQRGGRGWLFGRGGGFRPGGRWFRRSPRRWLRRFPCRGRRAGNASRARKARPRQAARH